MMLCITTITYSVNFNGDQIGLVIPQRGLRQGDPLSPYLFLICVEGLSNAIKKSVEAGKVSDCSISERAPSITHLLFANDSFIFCKANEEEVLEVRRILQAYEMQSGQAINLQKSGVFFSSNVRMDKQVELKSLLEVHNDLSTGKYLGLPSLIGRPKRSAFSYLKDRLWSKIKG